MTQSSLPKEYTDVILARREGPFVWPKASRYNQTELAKEYREAVSKVKKPRKTKPKPPLRQGKMDSFVRQISEAEWSLLLGAEKVTAPANTEFVFFSPESIEKTGAPIRRGDKEPTKPYQRAVTIPQQLRFGGGPFGQLVFRQNRQSIPGESRFPQTLPYSVSEVHVSLEYEDGRLLAIGRGKLTLLEHEPSVAIEAQLFDVAISQSFVRELQAVAARGPIHFQSLWTIANDYKHLLHVPGLSQMLQERFLLRMNRRPQGKYNSVLWLHTRMSHAGITLENWDFDNIAHLMLYDRISNFIFATRTRLNLDLPLKMTLNSGWNQMIHLLIFLQAFNTSMIDASVKISILGTMLREGHLWFDSGFQERLMSILNLGLKGIVENYNQFHWKVDKQGERPQLVNYKYIRDEIPVQWAAVERAKDYEVELTMTPPPDYVPFAMDYWGEWGHQDEMPYYEFSWDASEYFHFDADAGELYACVITYDRWEPEIVERKRRIRVPFTEPIPKPTGFEKLEDLPGLSTRREDEILAQPNNKHLLVKHFIQRMVRHNSPKSYYFNGWFREYGYECHPYKSEMRTAALSSQLDKVLAEAWFPDGSDALGFFPTGAPKRGKSEELPSIAWPPNYDELIDGASWMTLSHIENWTWPEFTDTTITRKQQYDFIVQTRQFYNGLDNYDKFAVLRYIREGIDLNTYWRSRIPLVGDWVRGDESDRLYNRLNYVATHAPALPFDLTVYRGVTTNKQIRRRLPLRSFRDNGFVSTSVDVSKTVFYTDDQESVRLAIALPEGSQCGFFIAAIWPGEAEFMLQAGLTFEFVRNVLDIVGGLPVNAVYKVK